MMQKSRSLFRYSSFILALRLAFLGAWMGQAAFAKGYFPNLNQDSAFRGVVTEALAQRARAFTFSDQTGVHQYVINYGQDYDKTADFFHNPVRDRVRARYGQLEGEADHFRELLDKVVYFPLPMKEKESLHFETYIHRPMNTTEHGARVDQTQEIPYFNGTFVEALLANSEISQAAFHQLNGDNNALKDLALEKKMALEFKRPSEHPNYQGPYFAFTMTEVPQEYLTVRANIVGMSKVKKALESFIREAKSESKALVTLKNAYVNKINERHVLISNYTNKYRDKVKARAVALAQKSRQPEQVYYDNYKVSREELSPEEVGALDQLDRLMAAIEDVYNKEFEKSVGKKYTPKNLVPYIRAHVLKADVLGMENVDQDQSSDEMDETSDDEFEEGVPAYYAVYALSKIGKRVYAEIEANEKFQ